MDLRRVVPGLVFVFGVFAVVWALDWHASTRAEELCDNVRGVAASGVSSADFNFKQVGDARVVTALSVEADLCRAFTGDGSFSFLMPRLSAVKENTGCTDARPASGSCMKRGRSALVFRFD